MILENRPGLLVELHMLKDYRTRVTGNFEILCALMEILNKNSARLITLNREADRAAENLGSVESRQSSFPLCLERSGETTQVLFRGYEYRATAQSHFGRYNGAIRAHALERYPPDGLRCRGGGFGEASRGLHHTAPVEECD